MVVEQRIAFADSEGDRWFAQHRERLERFDPQADAPLRMIRLYDLRPRQVLEIGAANGHRLAALNHRYGARCVAVEPSKEAVADGRERYHQVEFVRATSDAIPLVEVFDLVIVNHVLQWVDRGRLLKTVAEIDRLLADGGYLILGDFLPSRPGRVIHDQVPDQEVYAYMQNYAVVFLASGLYQRIALLTSDRGTGALAAAVADEECCGTWLLRKALHQQYLTEASSKRIEAALSVAPTARAEVAADWSPRIVAHAGAPVAGRPEGGDA